MHNIVKCTKCGTKNRMPKNKKVGLCGKCKATLVNRSALDTNFDAGYGQAKSIKPSSGFSTKLVRLAIVLIGGYFILNQVGTFDSAPPPEPYNVEETKEVRETFVGHSKFRNQIIQHRLIILGLYSGELDGLWGPGTKGALISFAQQHRRRVLPSNLFSRLRTRVNVDDLELFKTLYAIVPLIEGEQSYVAPGVREAPFSVSVPAGSNYFIWLVDVDRDVDVLTAFIKGGTTFETKAPLGNFTMKYASGADWFGDVWMFGPGTAVQKTDRVWEFSRDGRRVNGTSVRLQPVTNGNLTSSVVGRVEY